MHGNASGHSCAVPKILVWHAEMGRVGGFGDRMISVRDFFMICMLSRRLFFIVWSYQVSTPFRLSAAMQPQYVDWRIDFEKLDKYAQRANLSQFPPVHIVYTVSTDPSTGVDHAALITSQSESADVELVLRTADFEGELFGEYEIMDNTFTPLPREYIRELMQNTPGQQHFMHEFLEQNMHC